MNYQLVHTDQTNSHTITALALLQDASLVVLATDKQEIIIWDLLTLEMRRHKANWGPVRRNAMMPFPRGGFVVVGGADGHTRLWNAESGEIVRELSTYTTPVNAVNITTDGKYIIAGGTNGTLDIWRTTTGQALHHIEHIQGPLSEIVALTTSPDSHTLSVGRRYQAQNDYLELWDVRTGQHIRQLAEHQGLQQLLTSPGQGIISASDDGDVRIIPWGDSDQARIIETHMGTMTMAVMHHQPMLVMASQKPALELWSLEAGRMITTLPQPSSWVVGIAIDATDRMIITACHDGTLNIYERLS